MSDILSAASAVMGDTFARMLPIIIAHFGVDTEKVTDEARFIDDLGADSLDTIELVLTLEEEFGIELDDDETEHVETVGQLVKAVEAVRTGR